MDLLGRSLPVFLSKGDAGRKKVSIERISQDNFQGPGRLGNLYAGKIIHMEGMIFIIRRASGSITNIINVSILSRREKALFMNCK